MIGLASRENHAYLKELGAAETVELASKPGASHHYVFVEPNVPELEQIRNFVEEGKLKVHLAATFPLAETARAHEAMETGHTRGKIVLTI